jgi:hypothetical protein
MAVGTVSSTTSDTWQLISSQTPTSGTSVSFTGIAGYKTLMMAFKSITTAANSYMIVRFNNDSSAGSYNDGDGSGTSMLLATNASSRAGAIVIYDADKTVPHKMEKTTYDGAVSQNPVFYTDPVAITRIDLISRESQAFTAGTVYLYGIAA